MGRRPSVHRADRGDRPPPSSRWGGSLAHRPDRAAPGRGRGGPGVDRDGDRYRGRASRLAGDDRRRAPVPRPHRQRPDARLDGRARSRQDVLQPGLARVHRAANGRGARPGLGQPPSIRTTSSGARRRSTRRSTAASASRWSTGCDATTGAYRWVLDIGAPRLGPDGEFLGSRRLMRRHRGAPAGRRRRPPDRRRRPSPR